MNLAELLDLTKGKKIPELKSLIKKVNSGKIIVELSDKERKSYENWEKFKHDFNAKCKKDGNKDAWRYFTEKQYIINEIDKVIGFEELFNKLEYCKKHGHIEKEAHMCGGQGGTYVYYICGRCGLGYKRSPNSKEMRSWRDLMNTVIR